MYELLNETYEIDMIELQESMNKSLVFNLLSEGVSDIIEKTKDFIKSIFKKIKEVIKRVIDFLFSSKSNPLAKTDTDILESINELKQRIDSAVFIKRTEKERYKDEKPKEIPKGMFPIEMQDYRTEIDMIMNETELKIEQLKQNLNSLVLEPERIDKRFNPYDMVFSIDIGQNNTFGIKDNTTFESSVVSKFYIGSDPGHIKKYSIDQVQTLLIVIKSFYSQKIKMKNDFNSLSKSIKELEQKSMESLDRAKQHFDQKQINRVAGLIRQGCKRMVDYINLQCREFTKENKDFSEAYAKLSKLFDKSNLYIIRD